MSDFQYMVECTTRDVVNLLMEHDDMSMQAALDKFYNSRTYEKLLDEHSGLYFQSPQYVYEILRNETTEMFHQFSKDEEHI